MADPNSPLLEDAVHKLTPFLGEIVFVGGVTLGLLITDEAAAPIRGTTDVDVIAEIVTYADYIAFSERLRQAHFTEDTGLTFATERGLQVRDWPPSARPAPLAVSRALLSSLPARSRFRLATHR